MKMMLIVVALTLAVVVIACGNDTYQNEDVYYNEVFYCNEPTAPEVETAKPEPPEPDVTEDEAKHIEYIERVWLAAPYLVRLLPYRNNTYTDGMNIFTFTADGRVYVQIHRSEFALNIPEPQPQREIDIETVNRLGFIAAYNLDMGWWSIEHLEHLQHLIHIEDDSYFFHFSSPGGGSGEAFWSRDTTRLAKVCADGHFTDLGVGAEHVVWHNGYFYFLDMLEPNLFWTPGVGTIGRMNMDGSNRTTIVNSTIIGPFQILNDRIFFSCLYSGIAYSVDLTGNDRQSICVRIVPRYHRVWLDLYDSTIINRTWMSPGYGMGTVVAPDVLSSSAVMCAYGGCLVTFPHELRGNDPFTVVAHGYATHDVSSSNDYFMVFRSNIDDSFWAYRSNCTHWTGHLGIRFVFEEARKQIHYTAILE